MSQSTSFDIHINENEDIMDEIEKTLQNLCLKGYNNHIKGKKSIECSTKLLVFSTYIEDDEEKAFFKDIYNLIDINICCSMDVFRRIPTSMHYVDASKIVAGLMKKFPGDCLFRDHNEHNFLIRFRGNVTVNNDYIETNPVTSVLNELEKIPSTSVLSTQEKSDIAKAVLDEEVSTRDELEKYSSISMLNEQEKLKVYFLIIKAYERTNISRLMLSELEKADIPFHFGEIEENDDPEDTP